MKLLFSFTMFIACSLIFMGCTKNDTTAPYTNYGQYYFSGIGTASQLVPANPADTSKGTVNFTAVYDANLEIFNFNIVGVGLTSTPSTINFYNAADSGQVAPLDRSVALNNIITTIDTITHTDTTTASNTIWAYTKLSNAELTSLKNGLWYYVINTQNFSKGEVRGQIKLVDSTK
jgi:hypothetical protein